MSCRRTSGHAMTNWESCIAGRLSIAWVCILSQFQYIRSTPSSNSQVLPLGSMPRIRFAAVSTLRNTLLCHSLYLKRWWLHWLSTASLTNLPYSISWLDPRTPKMGGRMCHKGYPPYRSVWLLCRLWYSAFFSCTHSKITVDSTKQSHHPRGLFYGPIAVQTFDDC